MCSTVDRIYINCASSDHIDIKLADMSDLDKNWSR